MSFEMTILIFIEADYFLLIFEMSHGDASQIDGIGRLYRVSQKSCQQNAAGATVHPLLPLLLTTSTRLRKVCLRKQFFFARFLLRLSGIKRFQVMSMEKFGSTVLNFGQGFWAPTTFRYYYKGWRAIAKLKPLSLFISLLSMPKKAFDNVEIEK